MQCVRYEVRPAVRGGARLQALQLGGGGDWAARPPLLPLLPVQAGPAAGAGLALRAAALQQKHSLH